jgi:hypothetical protein
MAGSGRAEVTPFSCAFVFVVLTADTVSDELMNCSETLDVPSDS